MDVIIKMATMNDLEKVQGLSLKLSKKEQKEYDTLLNLEEDTTKHYKNRISKENGCVFVAIVNKKLLVTSVGNQPKLDLLEDCLLSLLPKQKHFLFWIGLELRESVKNCMQNLLNGVK